MELPPIPFHCNSLTSSLTDYCLMIERHPVGTFHPYPLPFLSFSPPFPPSLRPAWRLSASSPLTPFTGQRRRSPLRWFRRHLPLHPLPSRHIPPRNPPFGSPASTRRRHRHGSTPARTPNRNRPLPAFQLVTCDLMCCNHPGFRGQHGVREGGITDEL